MSARAARSLFVLVLVVNCIFWSQSRYAVSAESVSTPGVLSLFRRGLSTSADKCAPLKLPTTEQCSHVQQSCPRSDTVLEIPYTQLYFCASPAARPAAFVGLTVWLIFVFSTLGIAASDFFCPNLGTLSHVLGLDDNVAGVTFLAFGNGSPDVFSTFAAMKSHTASLALGELLGAATFISSVVVGSICLVKPFKVDPYMFLRDVGFFATAVALLQATLWDGKLYLWETLLLIGLYIIYVIIVIAGTWWSKRAEHRRKLAATVRSEYSQEEDPIEEPYQDEPNDLPRSHSLSPALGRSSRASAPELHRQPPSHLSIPSQVVSRRPSPRGSPTTTSHPAVMASFSLVGALEFRELVTSLTPHAAGTQLSAFEPTSLPFANGYYRTRSRGRTPASRGHSGEQDPWDYTLGRSLQLEHRAHSPVPDRLTQSLVVSSPQLSGVSPALAQDSPTQAEGGLSTLDPLASQSLLPTGRQKVFRALRRTWEVLFPTLRNFWAKSALTKLASVFAAPAVLALTLTLPVVITPYHDVLVPEQSLEGRTPAPLINIEDEDEGREQAVLAEEEVLEEMHDHLKFDKWLVVAQCILGPLFVAKILFDDMPYQLILQLSFGIAGLSMAILVAIFSEDGKNPATRLARCIIGFLVAVVWIMAIADEVVNVLQTFGFIFGLSNAIIGLTIFAMGNSLADLVANVSVAAFAPVMGFSACFGGPMLNMLLGVGVSGSYMVLSTGEPYLLDFSTTLAVSSVGLLAILTVSTIVVVLNGFRMTRKWGICLIVFYTVVLAVNIVVELITHK